MPAVKVFDIYLCGRVLSPERRIVAVELNDQWEPITPVPDDVLITFERAQHDAERKRKAIHAIVTEALESIGKPRGASS
jgi:hypothetical protein